MMRMFLSELQRLSETRLGDLIGALAIAATLAGALFLIEGLGL